MKLNFMTSLSNTGYGTAGKYITKELAKQNIDVALFPHGGGQFESQEEAQLFERLLKKTEQFKYDAPCINLWHQFDLANHIGRGEYYGFPIFELDDFKPVEKHHLLFPDHLIVTSRWAKNIVMKTTDMWRENISVAPLGVDRNLFYPYKPDKEQEKSIRDNPEQFIFFNIGKWEKRKGHDIIPKLFCKAFNTTDNVKLIMAPSNPFLNKEEIKRWEEQYLNCDLGSKITIIPRQPNHKLISILINCCDCGLFPARAEGWNMELLEAMSCGKQVITTNYSAHTEYVNAKNAYLVEFRELEKAYDGKWFNGEGSWMEIEYDEEEAFIEHMRHSYNNRKENAEGINTAIEFSWENTVNKIVDILKK